MTVVDGDPLAEWLDSLYFTILRLEDVELVDDDIVLDYSGTSLAPIERLVLERFGVPDDVLDIEERGFTDGVVAYIGETLMRRGGGAWDWTTGEHTDAFPDGLPLVRADAALDLASVLPVELLRHAVSLGDGRQLTALYRRWETAVEQLQRVEPGWSPRKELTSLDRPEPSGDFLPGWLAERAETFPTWVATYAPLDIWDFSPDSLSALDDLVRRVATSSADLYGPDLRGLADGATWYLGEVVRRGLGGEWNYNDGDTSDENLPYVDGIGPRDGLSLAGIAVRNVPDRPPGYLRSHYENVS